MQMIRNINGQQIKIFFVYDVAIIVNKHITITITTIYTKPSSQGEPTLTNLQDANDYEYE